MEFRLVRMLDPPVYPVHYTDRTLRPREGQWLLQGHRQVPGGHCLGPPLGISLPTAVHSTTPEPLLRYADTGTFPEPRQGPHSLLIFLGLVLVRARVNCGQGREVLSKHAVGPACLARPAVTRARWASDTQQEFSIRASSGWLGSKAFLRLFF